MQTNFKSQQSAKDNKNTMKKEIRNHSTIPLKLNPDNGNEQFIK